MESNKVNLDGQVQYLSERVSSSRRELYFIILDREREESWLQNLKQQAAKLQAFVYNFKTNNEEYIEVIKSIENKISEYLSDKKRLLQLATFSVIESIRNKPDKDSSFIYDNEDNQRSISSSPPSPSCKGNSNTLDESVRQQIVLPLPPYEHVIEDYKAKVLEDAEKLYNILTDQLVCEVINENVSRQSTGSIPSLPILQLEGGSNKKEPTDQNDVTLKDKQ